ncbi:MAG: hypothetical protein QXF35_00090 [Candidatus Bilamarchaeaceae archaeon]
MKIEEEVKKNIGLIIILLSLFTYVVLKFFLPTAAWLDVVAGLVIFLEMIFFVGLEVSEGAKKHGWKKEILDTVIGIILALLLWFGAQWILNTHSPISAVVSCSMLNDLQRGDFVIVQGADINAPEVHLTKNEFEQLVNGPFIVSYKGQNYTFSKPFNNYCYYNPNEKICNLYFMTNDEFIEVAGPATYHYKLCNVNYIGSHIKASMRCIDYIDIKGKRLKVPNKKNDIIVYTPRRTDFYGAVGDIVHRSVAKIIVDDEVYYLTAGDNNPVLDSQIYDKTTGIGNRPPSSNDVKGKVIARIPYLGYLKLFLSGFWQSYDQCSWVLER